MRHSPIPSCFPQSRRIQRRRGAALLIVLAFVVLVTGMIVAFFSRSMSDRKVSNSSASQVQTELLAQGALQTLVADLKQEIADGSTANSITTGSVTTIIYTPKTPANAVPALVGSTGTSGLENLIKRSANGQSFYSGTAAPNRASSASTSATSQNGRTISRARWNKPLLMPANSGTDLTPVGSTNFVPPDWVLMDRGGNNPTTWNNNLKWSASGTGAVIGRYAYAVYDEGGLLDMNVAGYPGIATSGTSATELARKGALAFADLTQLPLTAGMLTQADVDKIIQWRNAGTATSGTGYINAVLNNSTGFLSVSAPNDRAFVSRQELIQFMTSGALSVTKADAQNLLQYMGTFSRDLNQPSFTPDPNRPPIKTYSASSNYAGGNNQYPLDDLANPAFAALRVSGTFARNDGSIAQPGEPLVKKRFALNRLAWLTCKGPSGPSTANPSGRNSGDDDIKALKNAGITDDWLKQGTDANILKYFGLTWNDANKRWIYAHGDPNNGICCLPELVAGTVDPRRGSGSITGAPREPDFFELLKAAINVGSLGKACLSGSQAPTYAYQALRDTNANEQIIQIGANIIDQFDTDGFPTRIWYAGATGNGREFRGVEDLPYIYRVRTHGVQVAAPDPLLASGTTSVETCYDNGKVWNGSSWVPFVTSGTMAMLLLPEIWNPHDGSRALPSYGPAEIHLTADTTDPQGIYSYAKVSANSKYVGSSISRSHDQTPASFFNGGKEYNQELHGSGASQNNDLQFKVTTNAQFREPTALFIPDLPQGSDLKYGPNDWVVTGKSFGSAPPSIPLTNNAIKEIGGNPYLGICVGVAPLAWTGACTKTSGSNNPLRWDPSGNPQSPTYPNSYFQCTGFDPGTIIDLNRITYHLWYTDPYGTLQIYDEKYSGYTSSQWGGFSGFGTFSKLVIGTAGSPRLDNAYSVMVFADPRTSRWGAGANAGASMGPILAQSTNIPYPIPSPVCLPWRTSYTNNGVCDDSGGNAIYPYDSSGWYPSTSAKGVSYGLLSQNNPAAVSGLGSNPAGWYTDPDGVVRRAMGGYVSASTMPALTPIGLPNVAASVIDPTTALCTPPTATTQYKPTSTITINVYPGQNLSRPIVLNRPFKTVGELAYTFSDTPWRNLDLSTPESGNTALLDVFCIQDETTPDAVIAGKVNLNTRQVPVLKALLAGAAKEDAGSSPLAAAEINAIASALVTRTTGANTANGQGPLRNPAELVGRYVSGSGTAAIYHGFSEDIAVNPPVLLSSTGSTIQRFRETSIRALSNMGTTRVWNLMIDVIAQTGRYPQSASGLDNFVVEGEKRYWLHVAIDRCTGEVIDQQMEAVAE